MHVQRVFTCLLFGQLALSHVPVKQPAFRNEAATIRPTENDTVFLPCFIDDLGGNRLRWWKENNLLFDSDDPLIAVPPRISVMADGVTISGVTPEDSGNYTCEVVRPEPWTSLRLIHTVQVMHPPRLFPFPSSGYLEVRLGEKVGIGCSATGMPAPTIQWRTKETAMSSLGENTEKLEFTASSRLLSGIYQCEADNGIGDPVHANIHLRILHPPEIQIEKSRVHSGPGIQMALKCHVTAEPQSRLVWLFNEELLKGSNQRIVQQTKGRDNLLIFNPVAASDFGNYTCRASNHLGTSQSSIYLTGVANAAVIKAADIKAPDGVVLLWEVDSYSPVFEYKLSFRKEGNARWNSVIIPSDGHPSGPLHSKSYLLSGLDRTVQYEAKIYSRNRFGWSEPSETVHFGFAKRSYAKGGDGTETFSFSDNTIHHRSSAGVNFLHFDCLFAIAAFKFFPSICDIF